MAIKLSNFVEDARTFTFPLGDGEMELTYKPTSLSQGHIAKLQRELDKGEDTDPLAFAQLFCSIVTAWDFVGPLGEGDDFVAEDQPVPVEPRYVAWVPTSYLSYITERIGEDATPKGKKR